MNEEATNNRRQASRAYRRSLLWALCVSLPFLLVGTAAVLLGVQRRQVELDRALVAAIEGHKTAAALSLLKDGASPNAAKQIEAPLTLQAQLQELWNRLHGLPAARKPSGPTVLFMAVQGNDARVAEALLQRGVRNLHVRGTDGRTLISQAIDHENDDLIRLLWQNGAVEKDDLSPLLNWAVRDRDRKWVGALLARGAPVNGPNPDNQSPFYIAAETRDWSMMRFLLARGASVNGGGDNLDYASALSLAAERNEFKMTRFLLARGAKVNAEVRFGSALTKAAQAGHVKMVSLLLAHKANPNIGTYHNDLPILVADKPQILKLLLRAGADPNVHVWGGESLLGKVAENGNVKSIKDLLGAGAKINRYRNGSGTTALMNAAAAGRIQVVALLLRRGADVNVHAHTDQDYPGSILQGDTALDLAIRNRHTYVARLLRRWGGRSGKH